MAKPRVSKKERALILADSDERAAAASNRADSWAHAPEGIPYGVVFSWHAWVNSVFIGPVVSVEVELKEE